MHQQHLLRRRCVHARQQQRTGIVREPDQQARRKAKQQQAGHVHRSQDELVGVLHADRQIRAKLRRIEGDKQADAVRRPLRFHARQGVPRHQPAHAASDHDELGSVRERRAGIAHLALPDHLQRLLKHQRMPLDII